ncbi:hypothetical protein GCM10010156_64870 [Planobispora rosea]|uniref:Pycsar effector protein domain-containing protein n=1 Tax=Planobispora rosea TaxID=35762 RepID=A0A8J3SA10_PLARO|nr:Pycsar system effector family protein [Planobispora rosea]GGS97695.1 hypothetical protein GCM10010156_64870 [Planobispora rosea]GIH87834.1 hypothetical protein Pro02_62420 [Planobispora rosea]
MMPTTRPSATPDQPNSPNPDTTFWQAIPLRDPRLHPNCQWAITINDLTTEDAPHLWIDISAERPAEVAAFLLRAVRAYRPGPAAAEALQCEADAVRLELGRIDVKATALLGTAGTMFAVLAAALTVIPPPAAALAAVIAGAALLAAAIVVLLIVIRPALPRCGRSGTGFIAHADAADVEALIGSLTADPEQRLGTEILGLSALTRTKYRRLKAAVHLLLAALAMLVTALPLGAW